MAYEAASEDLPRTRLVFAAGVMRSSGEDCDGLATGEPWKIMADFNLITAGLRLADLFRANMRTYWSNALIVLPSWQ